MPMCFLRLNTFLVLLLFFGLITVSGQTENEKPFLRFKDISTSVGAPGEWARVIYQDSQGLMWFGTDVNFKSFNGYKYETYPLIDSDIIVTAITEDHRGDLWIAASADAIYRLNRKKGNIKRYQLDTVSIATLTQVYPLLRFSKTLFEDSKNTIWASTYKV